MEIQRIAFIIVVMSTISAAWAWGQCGTVDDFNAGGTRTLTTASWTLITQAETDASALGGSRWINFWIQSPLSRPGTISVTGGRFLFDSANDVTGAVQLAYGYGLDGSNRPLHHSFAGCGQFKLNFHGSTAPLTIAIQIWTAVGLLQSGVPVQPLTSTPAPFAKAVPLTTFVNTATGRPALASDFSDVRNVAVLVTSGYFTGVNYSLDSIEVTP